MNQPQVRDRRISRVIEILEGQLCRSWTTVELGQLVNLSASHLRRLFKEETGRTPLQHLRILRISTARSLLESEFLSVKEVMNRVGVSNHNRFVKDFKRVYGTVPSRINALDHD